MTAHKEKTRTIAGHRMRLLEGVRYIASRPMAPPKGKPIIVTVQPMIGAPLEAKSVQIHGLTYDESNRFLAAFNNGEMSFDGRVW